MEEIYNFQTIGGASASGEVNIFCSYPTADPAHSGTQQEMTRKNLDDGLTFRVTENVSIVPGQEDLSAHVVQAERERWYDQHVRTSN